MNRDLDSVARYGMEIGFAVRPRTILVEGTTDVELFQLAAKLEYAATGINLLGEDLAIVAAGVGDRGGTTGVIRELVCLRGLARTCLLPNGRPRYRFVGLFDNDRAGRDAVKTARYLDNSILEYKDVFRLWPVMPKAGNLDPGTMQKTFERENEPYKGLDWELEDLLPKSLMDGFISDFCSAVAHTNTIGDKVHRDLTRDGKAKLHRFVRLHAVLDDVRHVVEVLKTLRYYLVLK